MVGLTHSRQLVSVWAPHSVPTRTEWDLHGGWQALRKGAVFLWFYPILLSVWGDLSCKDLDSIQC